MRKVLWFILSLCAFVSLSVSEATAQGTAEYQLDVKVDKLRNVGNGMRHITMQIKCSPQSQTIFYLRTGRVRENETITGFTQPATKLYAPDQRPALLSFYTLREWASGSESYSCTYALDRNNHNIDVTFNNGNEDNKGVFEDTKAEITVQLRPKDISIKYFDSSREDANGIFRPIESEAINNSSNYILSDDYITLKATKGFVAELYRWEYRSTNGSWANLLSKVSYSTDRSEVTFKGTDLFDKETLKALIDANHNIQIRINTPTANGHIAGRVYTYYPQISAPNILNMTHTPTKCFAGGSETVVITLDRELMPGEALHARINRETALERPCTVIGRTVYFENIEAGSHDISIRTAYKGYRSNSRTRANYIVTNLEKVENRGVNSVNVTCFGANNGTISIQAAGGTQNFIAKLHYGDPNQPIQQTPPGQPFGENEIFYFKNLAPGNYFVTLYDNNTPTNCVERNNLNEVLHHQVTITQPQKLEIKEYFGWREPLGFLTADGEVNIRVSGGTRPYGAVQLIHESNLTPYTPTSSSADQGDILYRFTGLVRGNYTVLVRDAHYDPAHDASCGCSVTGTFFLSSPPLLEVAIEETHFINWFGGNQGELTAHAKGGVPISGTRYTFRWEKLSDLSFSAPSDSVARELTADNYRVIVSDHNGITATSAIYTLEQPPKLEVLFDITNVSCSGERSGAINARVSGGVPPYTYQWDVEGALSENITSLDAGIYNMKVTDVRGGHLLAPAEVKSSSTMVIEPIITQPSCLSPRGGLIELRVSGGTPPYSINWMDTNEQLQQRTQLPSGAYEVHVSDASGCGRIYSFNLIEPRGFTTNLGPDITLCRNQSRTISALSSESDLSYEWFYEGVPLPDISSQITVAKEGTYRVKTTNSAGCFAHDEVVIKVGSEVLDLDLAVPTRVAIGSEIHAVNISKMAADQIDWILPQGARVIKKTDTEAIFAFDHGGTYTLSMEGFKGGGASIITRTIEVVDAAQVELPNREALIKQFLVTPNPSTGYFKVLVELERAENCTLLLYSPSGVLMDRKEMSGVAVKTFEYDIRGNQQGVYTIHWVGKHENSVLQVEIKHP